MDCLPYTKIFYTWNTLLILIFVFRYVYLSEGEDDKGSGNKSPFIKDLFLFVGINDENENPASVTSNTDEDTNKMHSMNGYIYGNLPNFTMCVGATTRLHIGSLSHSRDVHGLRLHGHTFEYREKR